MQRGKFKTNKNLVIYLTESTIYYTNLMIINNTIIINSSVILITNTQLKKLIKINLNVSLATLGNRSQAAKHKF